MPIVEDKLRAPRYSKRKMWFRIIVRIAVVLVSAAALCGALAYRRYVNGIAQNMAWMYSGRLGALPSVAHSPISFKLRGMPRRVQSFDAIVLSVEYHAMDSTDQLEPLWEACRVIVRDGDRMLGQWEGIPSPATYHRPHPGACLRVPVPTGYTDGRRLDDITVTFEWLDDPPTEYRAYLWWTWWTLGQHPLG